MLIRPFFSSSPRRLPVFTFSATMLQRGAPSPPDRHKRGVVVEPHGLVVELREDGHVDPVRPIGEAKGVWNKPRLTVAKVVGVQRIDARLKKEITARG